MLTNSLKQKIKEHALKNINEEQCGLLLQSGDSLSIFPCKNISSNKTNHFEISPFCYLRAYDEGHNKIMGVYHSQRSESPSSLDIINKIGHNIYSIIYSVDEDTFIEVTENHLKYGKYLGLPFEINKNDCLSIVKNFYKNEFGIILGEYFRNDNWYKDNPNIIKESYKKEDFIQVEKEDLRLGDLLVFSFAHLGIYLEKDLVLHHNRGKLSNIEKLEDPLLNRLSLCLRHKSKL